MSSQDSQHWVLSGQDLIFGKIMMMVGLDSLESLYTCEQVCTAWNAMIMKNIWESPAKRIIFKTRIESKWSSMNHRKLPSEEGISHVKWLGKKERVLESNKKI